MAAMNHSLRSGLALLAGIALLVSAAVLYWIAQRSDALTWLLALVGLALTSYGSYRLRGELADLVRGHRGEIALYTVGMVGILVALAYLSTRFTQRWDMSEMKEHSLSPQAVEILQRIDKPVHVTFFYDPVLRDTVDLYEQIARHNKLITLDFYDPFLNPAQARLMKVQFAGTSVLRSEDRERRLDKQSETDIINALLRISRGATQLLCFLEGHNEPDPFSLESHDHMEGTAGHKHGLGDKVVVHEQHGMAKARDALESMNYVVQNVSLLKGGSTLDACSLLIVAGPKIALLPSEIAAIRTYIADGHNALFMLDPAVQSGLEALLREYGVVLDDNMIIDEASHFLTDVSAPAVTVYNDHQITRQLPLTFFPGVRSLSPLKERPPGVSAYPLIESSPKSYGETTFERAEFTEGQDLAGPLTLMVLINLRPETVNKAKELAAQLRGEVLPDNTASAASAHIKPARIVVAGDADFATNSFFHVLGNGNLFLNTVNSLAAQADLIGLEPRTFDLPRVNVTNQQMKSMLFLSVALIPALLALIGTAVWWRQR
jgi:ABC-type uncharacterized transport system involved in gliding motility auxiliary subunit